MRILWRLFMSLLAMAGLLLLSLFLIPADKIAQYASASFEAETGRKLEIEGGVSPRFWPKIGISTGPVRIANAAWGTGGPLLSAEQMVISVDTLALLRGNLQIDAVEMTRPELLLERSKKGEVNWILLPDAHKTTSGATRAQSAQASSFDLTLESAVIRSGGLRYIDHQNGHDLRFEAIEAEIQAPEANGRVTFSVSARRQGVALALEGDASPFSKLLAGAAIQTQLKAQIGESRLSFAGQADAMHFAAEGQVTAEIGSLDTWALLLGRPIVQPPMGLGAQERRISGQLSLGKGGEMHLRQVELLLDHNRLTGSLDFTPGQERGRVTGTLSAGRLDLSGLTEAGRVGGSAPAVPKAPAAQGWSRKTIDMAALGLVDGQLDLDFSTLDLGGFHLGAGQLRASLDRARLVVATRAPVAAYEGTITGDFVLNNRSGLSSGGNLHFKNIALQPLLSDVMALDQLTARADLSIEFLTSGSNVQQMMDHLSGKGELSVGKGEWRGFDIAGVLRDLNLGSVSQTARTLFNSAHASFTIAGGVLKNNDLVISAPLFSAKGQGQVQLGAQQLDYHLTPVALAGLLGKEGLTLPILIRGPWRDPHVSLDLVAMTSPKIEAERARLISKAHAEEQRLKQKLEQELGVGGVERNEGEKLEDAVRRRAQEAIKGKTLEGLGRLLGGN